MNTQGGGRQPGPGPRGEPPGVVHDFKYPIAMAFPPDGEILVTERLSGKVWSLREGAKETVKRFPVPNLNIHNELGLLGIALHPNYGQNRLVYVFHSHQMGAEALSSRIERFHRDSGETEVVVADIPAATLHNGGIIAFGPDGKLYAGIGDNYHKELAQVRESWAGKVLRFNDDGTIPEDNPFPGSPVYSLGHRNIFGLAFHPATGRLYIAEEGPAANDEVNMIQPGGNYGWPLVTGVARRGEFVDPIQTFTPPQTPTQLAFLGEDLLVPSWNFGWVRRLTLGGEKRDLVEKDEIVHRRRPFGTLGVFPGPDGLLYITTPEGIDRVDLRT